MPSNYLTMGCHGTQCRQSDSLCSPSLPETQRAFCVLHSLGKISLQWGEKYQYAGSIHKYQYKFGPCLFQKIYFRFLNFHTYKCSVRVAGTCRGHKSIRFLDLELLAVVSPMWVPGPL